MWQNRGPLWNSCHMVTLLGTRWYRGCWSSTFTKLHRRIALAKKHSPWKKYLCVLTVNPQWVDEIVFPQSKQENVVLEEACMSWSQFIQKVGAYCGQGREGKEEQQGKVSPRVVRSDWKSLNGHYIHSPVSSSTTLRTPGHYCGMPYGHHKCQGPLAPHPRVTTALCRVHRTCALCASPFLGTLCGRTS